MTEPQAAGASPSDRRNVKVGRVLAATIAGLLLAGCTPGSGDEPTQTTGATSPATTSTSGTTTAASTSADPLSLARGDLAKAHEAAYRAYLAATASPKDKNRVQALLALYVPGSSGAKNIQQRIAGLGQQGYAGRPGPRGYFVIEQVAVTSVDEGAVATVTVCTFDDGVVYDTRSKGPDGKPVIVNDAIGSSRSAESWLRRAGAWHLQSGKTVADWPGENRCPPKTG